MIKSTDIPRPEGSSPAPCSAWVWTQHAKRQWTKRGGTKDLLKLIERTSRPCGRKMMKGIRKSCPAHAAVVSHKNYTGFHYVTAERWVFVKSGNTVITCWPHS